MNSDGSVSVERGRKSFYDVLMATEKCSVIVLSFLGEHKFALGATRHTVRPLFSSVRLV